MTCYQQLPGPIHSLGTGMQKLEYKPHPSAISIYLQKSTRLLSVPHKHGYIPTIVLHHSLYALGKGFCIYITYRNISSTGHSIPNLFIKKKKTQQYSPCFEEACYLYRIFFFPLMVPVHYKKQENVKTIPLLRQLSNKYRNKQPQTARNSKIHR